MGLERSWAVATQGAARVLALPWAGLLPGPSALEPVVTGWSQVVTGTSAEASSSPPRRLGASLSPACGLEPVPYRRFDLEIRSYPSCTQIPPMNHHHKQTASAAPNLHSVCPREVIFFKLCRKLPRDCGMFNKASDKERRKGTSGTALPNRVLRGPSGERRV